MKLNSLPFGLVLSAIFLIRDVVDETAIKAKANQIASRLNPLSQNHSVTDKARKMEGQVSPSNDAPVMIELIRGAFRLWIALKTEVSKLAGGLLVIKNKIMKPMHITKKGTTGKAFIDVFVKAIPSLPSWCRISYQL